MQFSTKALALEKCHADAIIIGVYQDATKTPTFTSSAKFINTHSENRLIQAVKRGDLTGKKGQCLVLHETSPKFPRIIAVGLGQPEQTGIRDKTFLEAIRSAIKTTLDTGAQHILWCLHDAEVDNRHLEWKIKQTVSAWIDSQFRCDGLKSTRDTTPIKLKRIEFHCTSTQQKAVQQAILEGQAIAAGIGLTKTLGNLPGNICTPTYLAETAQELARQHKLKIEILGEKKIAALKMGSFLSVAKGSTQPPQFIVLQYQGANAKQRPTVLVGKGITFDSGGISLKPGEGMDEMKYDMCGAASVLGTLRAIAEMKLKVNVIGLIPTCENMPSGGANKPGDIVTSMVGVTIEILNTDAEGRLILCDALTYAERFKPRAVIDIATLTGACVIALGHVHSGLFSSDEALAAALQAASKQSGDTLWRMPLDDEYQEQLKSNFADLANIGGRPAGSVTAACFLARFTKAYPWAHLDIAGTAWKSGAAKGATGRPVALLVEYLQSQQG